MTFYDAYYRTVSCVRHYLTAGNTLGYGVHSPHLYGLVRFVIYDDTPYYCFSNIENLRARMLRDNSKIYVEDYGTGESGVRRICDVAATALMPRKYAQMLFRVVNSIHPKVCVELGTNLGVTTAYLSVAAGKDRVVHTFEGSGSILSVAKDNWKRLGCVNINPLLGNIDSTLEPFLKNIERVDFALIDANHTYDATLRYFSLLADKCGEQSVVVIDDIHHSREMGMAWEQIKNDKRVTSSVDFYNAGMLFFDKQFLPKHYKMRF